MNFTDLDLDEGDLGGTLVTCPGKHADGALSRGPFMGCVFFFVFFFLVLPTNIYGLKKWVHVGIQKRFCMFFR